MAFPLIACAVAAWVVLSVPIAVLIGRIPRRADSRATTYRLPVSRAATATSTGAVAGITR